MSQISKECDSQRKRIVLSAKSQSRQRKKGATSLSRKFVTTSSKAVAVTRKSVQIVKVRRIFNLQNPCISNLSKREEEEKLSSCEVKVKENATKERVV